MCAVVWRAVERRSERRRDAAYAAAIAPLKRALLIGMTKTEVEAYLRKREVQYHAVRYGGSPNETYEYNIGKEPGDGFICEEWNVYAAMEFDSNNRLTDVHVRKIGTCL